MSRVAMVAVSSFYLSKNSDWRAVVRALTERKYNRHLLRIDTHLSIDNELKLKKKKNRDVISHTIEMARWNRC